MDAIFTQRIRKAGFKLVLLAVLASVMASEPALAQRRGHGHGHVRFGVGLYVGVPLFSYPYYYPPAYYYPPVYYPPVVLSQPAPPVYVEQSAVQPVQSSQQAAPQAAPQPTSQPAQNWWYFCAESDGYYPYVKQCAAGWQRVSPQPPG